MLMVEKAGGSRGNPPCVGPYVSCHWRSALRAEDCIAWCMEGTSHVLSSSVSFLLLLLFFVKLFPTSDADAHLLKWNPHHPLPKMRAWRKRQEEERFENRNHTNSSFVIRLSDLLVCLFMGSSRI